MKRYLWLLGALTVGLGTVAGVITPAASAKTSHCLVINSAANTSFSSLQAGVDAAVSGGTLWVRGTCLGTTTIGTTLTLVGQHPNGFGAPTLDGNQQGSVLTIASGASVTVNGLTITGGTGSACGFATAVRGGGICNQGEMTLNQSAVISNTAKDGGGIFNLGANGPASLTLNDTSVSGNSASLSGGGIFLAGFMTMNGTSSVDGNTSQSGGNGINIVAGGVTMNDTSSISGNTSTGLGASGGGVRGGTVTMNDSSSISGNTSMGDAGGVQGSVTMNDSSTVYGNTSISRGGGVFVPAGDTLTMTGNSTIHNNSANPGAVFGGGGIFIEGPSADQVGGTVIGAVPATTCPATGGANVFCNTVDNVFPITADVRISPGFPDGVSFPRIFDYQYELFVSAGSSETTTFTVTNAGLASSPVLTLSGRGDSSFTFANDTCSTQALAAQGGSCTFDLKFTPPTTTACPGGSFTFDVLVKTATATILDLKTTGFC